MYRYRLVILLFIINLISNLNAQNTPYKKLSFFEPADTFHQKRFNYAIGISASTYTFFSLALYNTWYKKYDQESFHLFNDWGEWNNMDKYGHFYTSYFQSALCYKGAKWTGLSENKSIVVGVVCATLFQSTIEVMDGFSSKWGFSLSDVAMNTAGSAAFILQQKKWKDQRIFFKVSAWPVNYNDDVFYAQNGQEKSSQQLRADELFGNSFSEKYLKDYNGQIIWASANIKSFFPESSIPDYLNIALGYGAQNMFGGYENSWISDQGNKFNMEHLDRYHQFYIGLDFDYNKFKIKNHFLKSLLTTLNIFKLPLPAIEINTRGEFKFHFFSK